MMDKKTQKIGVICSIVQIILSIICLIYSAINQENIIMWVLFLQCHLVKVLSSGFINMKPLVFYVAKLKNCYIASTSELIILKFISFPVISLPIYPSIKSKYPSEPECFSHVSMDSFILNRHITGNL